MTETFNARVPPLASTIPSTWLAAAFGLARMKTRRPSGAGWNSDAQEVSATRRLDQFVGEAIQEFPKEDDPENQDDRRNVETAQIRQNPTNAAKQRLGRAVTEISDHIDEPILRVDHVERDQPTQDHADNDDVHIELQCHEKNGENGAGDNVHECLRRVSLNSRNNLCTRTSDRKAFPSTPGLTGDKAATIIRPPEPADLRRPSCGTGIGLADQADMPEKKMGP